MFSVFAPRARSHMLPAMAARRQVLGMGKVNSSSSMQAILLNPK